MTPRSLRAFLLSSIGLFSWLHAQQPGPEKKGNLFGEARSFYMYTANKDSLTDYQAWALGGKIGYTYRFSPQFTLGTAVYTSINTNIADYGKIDPATGRSSRYEEGLFDILHPNRDVVVLPGELYLKWKHLSHELTLGRMKMNTPFLNPQDGRMIPTLAQGIWYQLKFKEKNQLQLGFVDRIAPRSTSKFFNIGESIGSYPLGRNIQGQPSAYYRQTSSNFMLIGNLNWMITPGIQLDAWDLYTENIFNNLYLHLILNPERPWRLELEWLNQQRVGNGGNPDPALAYFQASASNTTGIKLGHYGKEQQFWLSYNRIFPGGQFIFPREWGREFLFSFQKRERIEGNADAHALVGYHQVNYKLPATTVRINQITSLGRHWKTSFSDAAQNKYGFPDYTQLNLDFFFLHPRLKGLSPELLLTAKWANGDLPDNANIYFNKTDMFHLNLIINYRF